MFSTRGMIKDIIEYFQNGLLEQFHANTFFISLNFSKTFKHYKIYYPWQKHV